MRVLLVEDTADVADAICASFERGGIACDLAGDLAAARDCLGVQRYDTIVLDLNLPDGSGTDILRELRRAMDRTPVLVLTAEFAIDDRVSALNEGADDYLVKPFDLRELEARVRALVRRDQSQKGADIVFGKLVFNPGAKSLRVDGRAVTLARRELALLAVLLANKGRVLGKERLYDSLYSFDDADVGLNAVELYIGRLRKKIAGSGTHIETLRGLGYRFDVDG